MKKSLPIILILSGIFISFNSALAHTTTVAELQRYCLIEESNVPATPLKGYYSGLCDGTINGTIQTIAALHSDNEIGNKYCWLPGDYSIGQGIKVFLRWAQDNPSPPNLQASYGIIQAHMEAFCGWKKR